MPTLRNYAADCFHGFVSRRIDPTFDALARVQERHPRAIPYINAALLLAFPAWCVLASVVHRARRRNTPA